MRRRHRTPPPSRQRVRFTKKKVHTLMETARVADTAVAVVVVLVVAYIVVLSESDVESARRVVQRMEEERREILNDRYLTL